MTNLTNIKKGDKITFKVCDFRNDTFKIITRKVQDVVIHHTGRIQGYNVRPIGSGVQYDQINPQDVIQVN